MATGGKPYYLAGLLPLLVAVGSASVDRWLEGGRRRARRSAVAAAIAVSAAVGAVIALPVLPAEDAEPVIALNGDVGETIGWRDFARTVAGARRALPASATPVIVTANYGQAGAIDRYGPALGLPRAFSGHNAYADWGPPPARAGPVIAVGLPPRALGHLAGCRVVARIDNRARVDNDERGTSVAVCRGPRRAWEAEWPALRHLG
jgi:hypothetical protein